MARVYVVQDPHDKNILPAAQFGQLQVMLFRKDLDQGVAHCIDVLKHKLSDIRSCDYILPIGDPIIIGVATHIAIHFGEGRVNLLRWDRETYRYNPEPITI